MISLTGKCLSRRYLRILLIFCAERKWSYRCRWSYCTLTVRRCLRSARLILFCVASKSVFCPIGPNHRHPYTSQIGHRVNCFSTSFFYIIHYSFDKSYSRGFSHVQKMRIANFHRPSRASSGFFDFWWPNRWVCSRPMDSHITECRQKALPPVSHW